MTETGETRLWKQYRYYGRGFSVTTSKHFAMESAAWAQRREGPLYVANSVNRVWPRKYVAKSLRCEAGETSEARGHFQCLRSLKTFYHTLHAMVSFRDPSKFVSQEHWRDYFRLRRWRRLSSNGRKLALVQGDLTFLISTHDSIIGRSVYENGNHDYFKFTRALRFLEVAGVKCLMDVGANIGTICISALVDGLADRALAVEPDPDNFKLLQVNSVLNDVDERIVCIQAAAAKSLGSLYLRKSPINHGDHRVADEDFPSLEVGNVIAVDAFPMDELYSEGSGQDLLWIDVQGFEVDVLRGASGLLKTGIPIVLEFCPSDLLQNAGITDLVEVLMDYTHFADLGREDVLWRPLADIELLVDEYGTNGRGTDIVVRRI